MQPDRRSARRDVRRPLAVLAMALAVAAFPLGALASHDFADVPDSNPFHGDISAIAAVGVTTGCGGGNYCPSAFVTREQMAAFMNRLGALSANKTPVVNADKLDGYDSSDLNRASFAGTPNLISGSETFDSLSVTIQVDRPSRLYILGNASVSSLAGATGAYGVCDLHVNDGPSITGSYQQVYISTNASWVLPCTTQGLSAACTPGSYTIDMDVQVSSNAVDVLPASLSVEVIPFGYNGQALCDV